MSDQKLAPHLVKWLKIAPALKSLGLVPCVRGGMRFFECSEFSHRMATETEIMLCERIAGPEHVG